MKKPITERLRGLIPNGDGHFSEYTQTLIDAIDEIEAMKEEIYFLRTISTGYKCLADMYARKLNGR